jgi:hypothetical protein
MESARFPNKNELLVDDVIRELTQETTAFDEVVLATDNRVLANEVHQEYGTKILHRKKNAADTNDSVFNIAKWAYYSLNTPHKWVAVILPNVINFNVKSVDECLRVIQENMLNEVRTYNRHGVENGVIVMRSDWLLNGDLSVYCGAVISDAKEIHYKEDL